MAGTGTADLTWALAPAIVLGSFGLGWLVARLGVAIALRRARRAAGAGWVERSRWADPARAAVKLDLMLVSLSIAAFIALRLAPDLRMAPAPWAGAGGLGGFFGVLAAKEGLERRLCRPGGTRRPGLSMASLLIAPVLVPFALAMAAMPGRWGRDAAAVLAAGAALATVNLVAGWLVPLRWLGLAHPASPRLAAAVEQAAARMGVRPRGVIELDSPNANALACPVPRLLIFTGPILDVLDDRELAAVVAHELGHLDEPSGVLLVRVLSSYLPIACTVAVPMAGSYGLLAGLAPIASLIVMMIGSRKLGRRMEQRSDRLGKEHEGEEAGTYARALELICRVNLIPVVTRSKRNIHPDLYDRLIAAGVPPDYPRPEPPPRVGLALLPAWLLLFAVALAIGRGLPGS